MRQNRQISIEEIGKSSKIGKCSADFSTATAELQVGADQAAEPLSHQAVAVAHRFQFSPL